MSRRSVITRGAGVLVAAGAMPATAIAKGGGEGRGGHGRKGGLPLVLAHRGAPAYRPEHTLAGYEYAISVAADFIEPDLVVTKDGVLVDRHEPEIGGTTDVADHPELADRKTTKTIDGTVFTGWFTEDFTLAELKTLRAKERIPENRPQNRAFDGLYEVPTFQEVIDLAREAKVGIIPETKHPTYFKGLGYDTTGLLLDALRKNGLNRADAPVIVQSFEVGNLIRFRRHSPVPSVQLIDSTGAPADLVAKGDPRTYADLITPRGLRSIARYANYIGPDKTLIVPRDAAGNRAEPTSLVADAHAAGIGVTPYTFRPENPFLPKDLQAGDPASPVFATARGDEPSEIAQMFEIGVDGLFADNPDTAVAVREQVFGKARR